MRVSRKLYCVFALNGVSLIMFLVFWIQVRDVRQIHNYQTWLSSNVSDREFTRNNATSNATCCVDKSKETSTPTCRHVSYYELYNKTPQVNNVTLYITSIHILAGRLGNQMFKYASMLGIARAQGRRMFIPPGTPLEQTFKISYVAVNESIKRWPVIHEISTNTFDAKMMNLPLQDVQIFGWLQSFWYFAVIMDEVRQEFTFRDSVANDAAKILRDVYVRYNSSMTVGVHVRRGDLMAEFNQRQGYGVPERSYFMKAFSLMKSKFPGRNITFVVTSDDLSWCRENLLGNDVFVMSPASASVHLAVLSSCDHVIMSAGTFGWWGAWMANGYVIYFDGFFKVGTVLESLVIKYQYYPKMWIGLGN